MPKPSLRNCHILIVEDEYLLADELRLELSDEGAVVVGMTSTVDEALELLEAEDRLDGAILDVNLGGEPVFPVADRLIERSVPFLFTTGYDASIIPPRFDGIVRCEKPINTRRVIQAIGRVIET